MRIASASWCRRAGMAQNLYYREWPLRGGLGWARLLLATPTADCLRGLLVGRSLVEFALRYCQVLIELAKPRNTTQPSKIRDVLNPPGAYPVPRKIAIVPSR